MRLLPLVIALCAWLFPSFCAAREIRTEAIGQCEVFWETEGPYVQAGDKAFALPTEETVLKVTYEDAERLVDFLRAHCEKDPGCELTFETETKAIMAAKAPGGQSIAIPYMIRIKQALPGTPFTFRTTLRSWIWDTFALSVSTVDGDYCIPNQYVWSDYHDRVRKVLQRLGAAQADLNIAVTITVYSFDGTDEECQGYIADITPAM